MADDPFSSLGASPPQSDDPFAALGNDPFANLGRSDLPGIGAEKPTRFIDLIRHPIASAQALLSRSSDVAADSYKHGTLAGAATGALADAATAATLGPEAQQRAIADEKAARPRPAGSALEQISDFGAGVVGSLPSPESWVSAPVKGLEIAGRPIASQILRHAAGGAIVTGVTDPAVQGANIARGTQDRFSVGQALAAPVMGLAAGAGFAGAGHGAAAAGDIFRFLGEGPKGIPDHADRTPAPTLPPPNTVDGLWTRLVNQESGNDQSQTSEKGARGVAQLMPHTAEEVAAGLGRPDLAELAMGEGPMAAVANEILGKTYLNEQLANFDGDPALALAAYNAGPGRVRQWIETFGHPDQVGRARWLAMIPFKETRDYVHTVLGDVAGAPHTLTPEDHAYVRGQMDTFPQDHPTELPPLADAQHAAADAVAAHATPGEASPADGPQAYTPAPRFTIDGADAPAEPFPGDVQGPALETRADIPWDGEPTPAPTDIPAGQDLTEQALDQMRTGKRLQMGEGPSLIEGLVKAGGMRDEGGELTGLLGGEGDNRLLKMLRRKKAGLTLNEAVEWAHDRHYIGDPGSDVRPDPAALLEALRREIAGDKVYPADRINEHARQLQAHMQDLDEILQHLGMDPAKHSNAEIRDAMDQWMRGAEAYPHPEEMEPGSLGEPKGPVLAVGDPKAMASGAEAVQRARDAAQRAAIRNEIANAAATTSSGLRGARQPGAQAAPTDAAGNVDLSNLPKVRGIPEIVRRLADALGYPVRQGRMGVRGALGTYNRISGMVRSRGRYDLNTLAHEFGHALEFTDGHQMPNVVAAMKAHARTLKALDYMPSAARRHEGFAEWFRWYITHPAYADAVPGGAAFRQDFEAAMTKDAPQALEAIREAQRDYQGYLDSSSVAATREHVMAPPHKGPITTLLHTVATKGPIGAMKAIADEAYRGAVDQLHPWKLAVEKALDIGEKRLGVRPTLSVMQDPYKLLRSMASVAATGHMDLIHGVHGYHSLDPESPSFVQALTHALGDRFLRWDEGAIQDFGTYLVGRRVLHLYERVGAVWRDEAGVSHGIEQPPDNLSATAWRQAVGDFEAANPHWPEAADMIYAWNTALWKKRFESGLITEHQYASGLEDHPDYVPLFRDISDKEVPGDVGGKRGSSSKAAGGVVRLRGSDRAYINPLHSMMDMAYELNAQIARNDALKALDDIGRVFGPDVGQVVERIPPKEMSATHTSVEEVIGNAARQFGVSRRDAAVITDAVRQMFNADAEDSMGAMIFRPKDAAELGEPIVYVWRDGERIPLRLPDGKWGAHMVETLAGMTTPIRSLWLDLASMPARALRAGVTAHPAFFLANSFRDQMSAFVLTDVGYRPFWDQARGFGHELRNHVPWVTPDDLTRIYNVVGGEVGGAQSAAEHSAHRDQNIQALRQRGKTVRHFATWNGFAHFTEISETGTRLGIFERALQAARARGLDDFAAAKEAAFEARDYMDFDRHGAWAGMRIVARVVPFMNAGLQALDKTARVAGGVTHLPQIIRPLFGAGPPASAAEYKAFSHAAKLWTTAGALAIGGLALRWAYKDDPEYQEMADMVRNTHWVVRLPDGHFAVIPKPYEIAAPANIMERAFEATALHDPTAWKRLTQGLEDIFIPAHDPAFLMPILDVFKNRDNLGSPIVPDYLKDKLPRDQYTDRTSDLSKWVGSHVGGEQGVSPAVIDFLLRSWGGSNARDALDAMHQKAPMADTAADTFVVKRFVKDWTRGAVSSKQFYDLASASDGTWGHAVNSLDSLINDGGYDEAIKRLKAMDGPQRAYAIVQVFGKGDGKQDHPMIRAQEATAVLGGLARDLMDGNVRGPDFHPIEITPQQRTDAVRQLREMVVAEQRNSMIMAGIPGWDRRAPLPTEKYLLEFERSAPQLVPALVARLQMGKVQALNVTAQNWAAGRHMLEAQIPDATLHQMMMSKRFAETKKGALTSAATKRAMGDVVPVAQ